MCVKFECPILILVIALSTTLGVFGGKLHLSKRGLISPNLFHLGDVVYSIWKVFLTATFISCRKRRFICLISRIPLLRMDQKVCGLVYQRVQSYRMLEVSDLLIHFHCHSSYFSHEVILSFVFTCPV